MSWLEPGSISACDVGLVITVTVGWRKRPRVDNGGAQGSSRSFSRQGCERIEVMSGSVINVKSQPEAGGRSSLYI
jgi:hypothetical protein